MMMPLLRGFRHSSLIITLALIFVHQQDSVYANKLTSLSFEPPFRDIDNSGLRMVSTGWRTSGATVINNNFVRLTPDQQSKKGALWSRAQVSLPSFSVVLKFLISGKGKNFFGDGIALWLVQQPYYSEGEVHGFHEHYYGIGIIVDTFRNTESHAHRDVTVLINDGEQTYEMMTKAVQGCNMLGLRYDGDRADFKVTHSSQLKITIDGKKLTVLVDPKGDGDYLPCVDIADVGLSEGWGRKAYVGLTAATGQLSDNHDIVSLSVYADEATMEKAEKEKYGEVVRFETSAQGMVFSEKLVRLEVAANKLLNRLEFMDKHHEHDFASASDNIADIYDKLRIKEEDAEHRISVLEDLIHKVVSGPDSNMKLYKLEEKAEIEIDASMKKFENKVVKDQSKKLNINGSWHIPFVSLFFLFILSGFIFRIYYKKMMKTIRNN